ncbi:MAG: hypothetical protein CL834_06955 [Crocinitomicaceae bacterium]|jgi:hypothetical protein|nr:hypothetical protein [Crocinitomicaceae bacterium]|tara:strand:+ start:3540 stop:3755 length:216 start_codon:yes stop_codon:yes gene_type:complete
MKGWTVVYSDGFPPSVELRRTVLDQQRIPAVVLNKKDSSYLFGFVELYVLDEDVTRARELLDNQDALSDDS